MNILLLVLSVYHCFQDAMMWIPEPLLEMTVDPCLSHVSPYDPLVGATNLKGSTLAL